MPDFPAPLTPPAGSVWRSERRTATERQRAIIRATMMSSLPVSVAPTELELPEAGAEQLYEVELENAGAADVFDVTFAVVVPSGGDYDAEIRGIDPEPPPFLTAEGAVSLPPLGLQMPDPTPEGDTAWLFYLRRVASGTSHVFSIAFRTNRADVDSDASLMVTGFDFEPLELRVRPSEVNPGGRETLVRVAAFGQASFVGVSVRPA
jgi:hypothetical protein